METLLPTGLQLSHERHITSLSVIFLLIAYAANVHANTPSYVQCHPAKQATMTGLSVYTLQTYAPTLYLQTSAQSTIALLVACASFSTL